jgi:adenine specific DNA methylase Mod
LIRRFLATEITRLFGAMQVKRSFEDRWSGGMSHYIGWLRERVEEMHRILKKTGSIYLHCDWHADAYIRVQILDPIFGEGNFRNEIVWHYDIGHAPKIDFKRKHDTIYRYTKDKKFIFNEIKLEPLNTKRYNLTDIDNRKYFIRGDSGKKCYADDGGKVETAIYRH